ncbi:hypothetical protein WDZ92_31235 [Nostoc sp. NIES-2111]
MKKHQAGRWPGTKFRPPHERPFESLRLCAYPRKVSPEEEAVRLYAGADHERRWQFRREFPGLDWAGVRICSRRGQPIRTYEDLKFRAARGIVVPTTWRPVCVDVSERQGRRAYNLFRALRPFRDTLSREVRDQDEDWPPRLRRIVKNVTETAARQLVKRVFGGTPYLICSEAAGFPDHDDPACLDRNWLASVFDLNLEVPTTKSGARVGFTTHAKHLVHGIYDGTAFATYECRLRISDRQVVRGVLIAFQGEVRFSRTPQNGMMTVHEALRRGEKAVKAERRFVAKQQKLSEERFPPELQDLDAIASIMDGPL